MSNAHSNSKAGSGVIIIPGARFFPEGVTVAQDGSFYVGSMEEGCILRVPPGAKQAEPFILSGLSRSH